MGIGFRKQQQKNVGKKRNCLNKDKSTKIFRSFCDTNKEVNLKKKHLQSCGTVWREISEHILFIEIGRMLKC